MSFPPGHSVNDGINKDHYLGVLIDLTYPTIDSFTTMVKALGPEALMYKRDLCRAYHQIWTDPFDVPYQGFYWQGHSTLTQFWYGMHFQCLYLPAGYFCISAHS